MTDLRPDEIEKRSMEIIRQELEGMGVSVEPENEPVLLRAIHTTADFDYVKNLYFSDGAVRFMKEAIKKGVSIVTDTNMALAGINKKKLEALGSHVYCYMADEDIAGRSKETGRTRASLSMDKAAALEGDVIFAIGNAPTALIRLHELTEQGVLTPRGIIGVPVGFVNVVEAKELIMDLDCPLIVARGRKGGSTVAAAICNALIYDIREDEA
ncbi:MAG: precorrin-8X methylmutase [Lachnospiraceae bacterium]|nr:precorrin-8X methylmutase [Lachnospiraceae bacterium]